MKRMSRIGPCFGMTEAGRRWRLKVGIACMGLASGTAFAATPTPDVSAAQTAEIANAPEADTKIEAKPVGQWTGLWTRSTLFGDMGGSRSGLGKYGISLLATETSEYLANVRGGLGQHGDYDGLTTVTLGLDTQKAFGWDGGTFNISALNIPGRNLSSDSTGTLNNAIGIDAQVQRVQRRCLCAGVGEAQLVDVEGRGRRCKAHGPRP